MRLWAVCLSIFIVSDLNKVSTSLNAYSLCIISLSICLRTEPIQIKIEKKKSAPNANEHTFCALDIQIEFKVFFKASEAVEAAT